MVKRQILLFLLRWIVSSVAMWLCIHWFGQLSTHYDFSLFLVAGLVFSLVNSVVKPIVTMISLPLVILTMGAFTLILNIAMVAFAIWLLPGVSMNFWGVVLSTLVISIINGLVNFLVPAYNKK